MLTLTDTRYINEISTDISNTGCEWDSKLIKLVFIFNFISLVSLFIGTFNDLKLMRMLHVLFYFYFVSYLILKFKHGIKIYIS